VTRAALASLVAVLIASPLAPGPSREYSAPEGEGTAGYPTAVARPDHAPVPTPPEIVAPGRLSLEGRNETFPAVDPVDGSLWFSIYEGSFEDQTILRALADGASWGDAETAPFSGRWGDRAPRFSPDGATLYFTSNRPRDPGGSPGDMNVWAVERRSGGGWSEPRLLPPPVNSPAQDIHPAITPRALYVASDREPGLGRSDVYRIPRLADGWGDPESLPVNDERSQPDLLVGPDEGWMILAITDHPDGLGGDDLFLVRRSDQGWGDAEHLPAPVNSEEYEYGPTLSPDGGWIYFTSHRRGSADIYRIPLSEVGLRP
jgi:hypothetical protein